jgi:hypothetical protein
MLQKYKEYTLYMTQINKSTVDQVKQRWQDLDALRKHYADFRNFYADVSEELIGFTPTDMQYDMAAFLAYGPEYLMIQAQRG